MICFMPNKETPNYAHKHTHIQPTKAKIRTEGRTDGYPDIPTNLRVGWVGVGVCINQKKKTESDDAIAPLPQEKKTII